VIEYHTGGTGVSPVLDRRDAGPTVKEFERVFTRSA